MGKPAFFLRFYKSQKMRFAVLVFIFAFAGAILSCSLLVQSNNKAYARAQAKNWESELSGHGGIVGDDVERELAQDDGTSVFSLMGRVMGIFALGSILIVVWGCSSILMFQNRSMEKSYAMMKIFGMGKRDIFIRALVEGVSFGVLGGLLGDAGGYFLFSHLSKKLCHTEGFIPMFSLEMFQILLLVVCILTVIAFFGNLISGLSIYEMPIIFLLFGRKGEKEKQTNRIYWIIECIFLYAMVSVLFRKNWKDINIMLLICAMIVLVLLVIFYIFFNEQGRKRNHGIKTLEKMSGISYRFLCSRHKRDAMLAATVSVGAILICVWANFIFDFRSSLRKAFSKNNGYTTVVEEPGLKDQGMVQEILDKNGYLYTKGYIKRMRYEDIGVKHVEGEWDEFDALVIDGQTDESWAFQVPEGCFAAENYFMYRCGLDLREESGIFGKDLICSKNADLGNVRWKLLSYHFYVNRSDFGWGLDDTWDTAFIMDIDLEAEEKLDTILAGQRCNVMTTTESVNEVAELLSDYLSVVAVTGILLILVTGTFFYSMVRSDLLSRKKEIFLYQVFGASRRKAFWVVFLEYLMIAWAAAVCVLAASTLVGGFVYGFLLRTFYPLSVPTVIITGLSVTIFVLGCCYIAQWMNFRSGKMEMIRDE